MNMESILTQSRAIRAQCFADSTLSKFIDMELDIPRPFMGSGDIRLIVIGQDPTVKNIQSRQTIKTVLQLDKKNGQLFRYIERICSLLGLILENVYATNIWKCFYTEPPTAIEANYSIDVLANSIDLWLTLLKEELKQYPDAKIITLGEPVLKRLVHSCVDCRELKRYWGYTRRWQTGELIPVSHVTAENSRIDRVFFPFPHQPSSRYLFYRERLTHYADYMHSN